MQGAVNNTGVILAQSIENHNGTIRLLADTQTGTATVAGTLDVSGRGAGQSGGTVAITGRAVKLAGATITASGRSGGGRVAVGGNLHGTGPLANAQSTSLDGGVTITAAAITAGNGGEIAVWSDGTTAVDGTLRALGGAASGDGGYIETSGHTLKVADSIVVNTSAASGSTGMWLLDPTNFVISPGGAVQTVSGIGATTLQTNLGTTNFSITTVGSPANGTDAGDITVNAMVAWAAPTKLTLTAAGDIILNPGGTITPTNGSVEMTAGRNVFVNAAVTLSGVGASFVATAGALGNVIINKAITSNGVGGSIVTDAGLDLTMNTGGTVTATDGSYRATIGRDWTLNSGATVTVTRGTLTATVGRDVNLNSGSTITTTGAAATPSDFILTAGGDINEKAVISITDGSLTAKAKGNIDINLVAGELITTTNGNIVLKADSDGTGQTLGDAGGTVTFSSCASCIVSTASTATNGITSIYYNPASYAALTDYSNAGGHHYFATAAAVYSYAWAFAKGNNKTYDGTDAATVAFATTPAGTPTDGAHTVTLDASAATATFNNKNVGTGKTIALTGYVLGGTDAAKFALFNGSGATTADITPKALSIKASDAAKVYGQWIDLRTYTTVGLVGGDTIDDVSLSSPGAASDASAAGSPYMITPKNASGGSFLTANYAITYLQGKLVVTAAAPGSGGGTPSSGGGSGTTSPGTTSPGTTSPSTTSPSITSPDSTLHGGSSDTTSPDSISRGGSSDSSSPITPGADTGAAAGAGAIAAGAGQAVMAGGVPGAMMADEQAATMMVATPTGTVLIAGPAPGRSIPLLPGKQDRN